MTTTTSTVLVVDDDDALAEMIGIVLAQEGYNAVFCENGSRAFETFMRHSPDLVLLDLMLPGKSGIEVCEQIRSSSNVPIIMLTAKGEVEDRIIGLELGADDYLVKPFSQAELLMKVKSLLRRYTEYQRVVSQASGVTALNESIRLDSKKRCVIKEGKRIPLTEKEYAIMRYFVEHRGEIVGNKDLYEGVWNGEYRPSDGNTVMVHVLNLRKKLEDDANHPKLIKTIWGKGYKVE